MATYSGFASNLLGSLNLDIMSSVVLTTAPCSTQGNTSGTYNCGYVYIGNLLIQFTDIVNLPGTTPNGPQGNISFPKAYTSGTPYCILTSIYQSGSSGSNYSINVSAPTAPLTINTQFTVTTNNNGGFIQYIAIGPR